MADVPYFKILGGTDPTLQSLGVMTQGIGFPLRDVEPTTSGGPVTVLVEEALSGGSNVDQDPTTLGVPIRISFGDAVSTPFFTMDATGLITCLVTDEYHLRAKFTVGRRGTPAGIAQIYVRLMRNGVQFGTSSHAIVDATDIEVPFDFEGVGVVSAGDVLEFQLVRDTDGANSGGLTAGIPSVAGWNPSPSARFRITRYVAVQT